MRFYTRYFFSSLLELERRHLRTIETSTFFLGIATHVSKSAKAFVGEKNAENARSGKDEKRKLLIEAIIDEARAQGRQITRGDQCAKELRDGRNRKEDRGLLARLPPELTAKGWPSWRRIQELIIKRWDDFETAGVTKEQ